MAQELKIKINADTTEFTKSVQGLGGEAKKAFSFIQQAGATAAGIFGANMFQGAISGIREFTSDVVNAVNEMQMLEKSVQSIAAAELIKSSGGTLQYAEAIGEASDNAKELMGWLRDLAIVSPYGYQAVADVFKQNANMGQSIEVAKRTTNAVLNLSSGLGLTMQQMGGLGNALAQTSATGVINKADIRQFANNGFGLDKMNAVFQQLSKNTGILISDYTEFNHAVEEGKISTDQFFIALDEYAQNNYGGSVDSMAKTIGGLKSTMEDIGFFAKTDLFKPLGDSAAAAISPFVEAVSDFLGKGGFEELGQSILDWAQPTIDIVNGIGEEVTNGNMARGFKSLYNYLKGTGNNLGAVYVVLKRLGGEDFADEWIGKIKKLKSVIDSVVANKDTIIGAIKGIGAALATALTINTITKFASALAKLNNPVTWLVGAGALLGVAWQKNLFNIQEHVEKLKNKFNELKDIFKEKGFSGVWDNIKESFEGNDFLTRIAVMFEELFNNNIKNNPVVQYIQSIVKAFQDSGLEGAITKVKTDIDGLIAKVLEYKDKIVKAYQEGGLSGVFQTIGEDVGNYLEGQFSAAFERVKTNIGTIATGLFGEEFGQKVKQGFTDVENYFNELETIFNTDGLAGVFEKITTDIQTLVDTHKGEWIKALESGAVNLTEILFGKDTAADLSSLFEELNKSFEKGGWEGLGQTIGKKIRDGIITWLAGEGNGELAEQISTLFDEGKNAEAFDGIGKLLSNRLLEGIKGISNALGDTDFSTQLQTTFDEGGLEGVGKKIGDSLWKGIKEKLTELLGAETVSTIETALSTIGDIFGTTFDETKTESVEALNESFEKIKNTFDSETWKEFGKTLQEIGTVIGAIVLLIANMALGSLDSVIAGLGNTVADLLVVFQDLEESVTNVWNIIKQLLSGDFKGAWGTTKEELLNLDDLRIRIQLLFEDIMWMIFDVIVGAVLDTASAMATAIKAKTAGLIDLTDDVKGVKDNYATKRHEIDSENNLKREYGHYYNEQQNLNADFANELKNNKDLMPYEFLSSHQGDYSEKAIECWGKSLALQAEQVKRSDGNAEAIKDVNLFLKDKFGSESTSTKEASQEQQERRNKSRKQYDFRVSDTTYDPDINAVNQAMTTLGQQFVETASDSIEEIQKEAESITDPFLKDIVSGFDNWANNPENFGKTFDDFISHVPMNNMQAEMAEAYRQQMYELTASHGISDKDNPWVATTEILAPLEKASEEATKAVTETTDTLLRINKDNVLPNPNDLFELNKSQVGLIDTSGLMTDAQTATTQTLGEAEDGLKTFATTIQEATGSVSATQFSESGKIIHGSSYNTQLSPVMSINDRMTPEVKSSHNPEDFFLDNSKFGFTPDLDKNKEYDAIQSSIETFIENELPKLFSEMISDEGNSDDFIKDMNFMMKTLDVYSSKDAEKYSDTMIDVLTSMPGVVGKYFEIAFKNNGIKESTLVQEWADSTIKAWQAANSPIQPKTEAASSQISDLWLEKALELTGKRDKLSDERYSERMQFALSNVGIPEDVQKKWLEALTMEGADSSFAKEYIDQQLKTLVEGYDSSSVESFLGSWDNFTWSVDEQNPMSFAKVWESMYQDMLSGHAYEIATQTKGMDEEQRTAWMKEKGYDRQSYYDSQAEYHSLMETLGPALQSTMDKIGLNSDTWGHVTIDNVQEVSDAITAFDNFDSLYQQVMEGTAGSNELIADKLELMLADLTGDDESSKLLTGMLTELNDPEWAKVFMQLMKGSMDDLKEAIDTNLTNAGNGVDGYGGGNEKNPKTTSEMNATTQAWLDKWDENWKIIGDANSTALQKANAKAENQAILDQMHRDENDYDFYNYSPDPQRWTINDAEWNDPTLAKERRRTMIDLYNRGQFDQTGNILNESYKSNFNYLLGHDSALNGAYENAQAEVDNLVNSAKEGLDTIDETVTEKKNLFGDGILGMLFGESFTQEDLSQLFSMGLEGLGEFLNEDTIGAIQELFNIEIDAEKASSWHKMSTALSTLGTAMTGLRTGFGEDLTVPKRIFKILKEASELELNQENISAWKDFSSMLKDLGNSLKTITGMFGDSTANITGLDPNAIAVPASNKLGNDIYSLFESLKNISDLEVNTDNIQNWNDFGNTVSNIGSSISSFISSFGNDNETITKLFTALQTASNKELDSDQISNWRELGKVISSLGNAVSNLILGFGGDVKKFNKMKNALKNFADVELDVTKIENWDSMQKVIASLGNAIGLFQKNFGEDIDIVKQKFGVLKGVAETELNKANIQNWSDFADSLASLGASVGSMIQAFGTSETCGISTEFINLLTNLSNITIDKESADSWATFATAMSSIGTTIATIQTALGEGGEGGDSGAAITGILQTLQQMATAELDEKSIASWLVFAEAMETLGSTVATIQAVLSEADDGGAAVTGIFTALQQLATAELNEEVIAQWMNFANALQIIGNVITQLNSLMGEGSALSANSEDGGMGGIFGLLFGGLDVESILALLSMFSPELLEGLMAFLTTEFDSNIIDSWTALGNALQIMANAISTIMIVLTGGELGEDGEVGTLGDEEVGSTLIDGLENFAKAAEAQAPIIDSNLNPVLQKMADSMTTTVKKFNELAEFWLGSRYQEATKKFIDQAEKAESKTRALESAARDAEAAYRAWADAIWAVINALMVLASMGGGGGGGGGAVNPDTGKEMVSGDHVPDFAGGTHNFRYGTAIVGEHGPELITNNTSQAWQVFSNNTLMDEIARTRHSLNLLSNSAEYVSYNRILGSSGGGTITNDNSQNINTTFGTIVGDDAFRAMVEDELTSVVRRELWLAR